MSRPALKARSPAARSTTAFTDVVEFDDAPDLGHLLAHGPVERVERVRPVQRDGGDVVWRVHVEQDRVERVIGTANSGPASP